MPRSHVPKNRRTSAAPRHDRQSESLRPEREKGASSPFQKLAQIFSPQKVKGPGEKHPGDRSYAKTIQEAKARLHRLQGEVEQRRTEVKQLKGTVMNTTAKLQALEKEHARLLKEKKKDGAQVRKLTRALAESRRELRVERREKSGPDAEFKQALVDVFLAMLPRALDTQTITLDQTKALKKTLDAFEAKNEHLLGRAEREATTKTHGDRVRTDAAEHTKRREHSPEELRALIRAARAPEHEDTRVERTITKEHMHEHNFRKGR